MKITKLELKEMITECLKEELNKINKPSKDIQKLKKTSKQIQKLKEDYDDEDEYEEEYEDFEDFANERLDYECRAKECWMNPNDNGKMHIKSGNECQCDLLWVAQGDVDSSDLDTLLDCFGGYYTKETDGKTYTIIMKSRSYPGDGRFYIRTVKFNNGEWKTVDEEDTPLYSGTVELYLDSDSLRESINDNSKKAQFVLACHSEDTYGYGETIGEAINDFEAELDYLNEYGQPDDGYEITDNVVGDLEFEDGFNLNNNSTVQDYLNELVNKGKFTSKEEAIQDIIDKDVDQEVIARGQYTTYETRM